MTSLRNYLSPSAYQSLLTEKIERLKTRAQASVPPDAGTFTDFKRTYWRGYQHTPFQQAIDEALMSVAEYVLSGGARGHGRLIINIPPRHGKTLSVSKLFPAWMLTKNPDLRLIAASYGASLAYSNSRYVRNLIRRDEFAARYGYVRLAEDSQAVNYWNIAGRLGGLIAVGVGAGVTGHGGNLIMIDDPVKSRAEAESAIYRQRARDWYTNDLYTRLEEPGGGIILMQTRWHEDDLAGWLLSENADDWRVLKLPALALEDDPLGRAPGDALWPERYGADKLQRIREQIGEYAFAALYQQQPLPPGGGLFQPANIQIVDAPPPCTRIVRFYDLAITAKKHSDYTVGVKLGITADERIVILDVYRVQKEAPDVERGIVQNAQIDGRAVHIRLEAEKAGITQLQYLLRNSELRGFTIDAKAPEGDKYTRATPVASRVNAGMVMMVRAPWNRALLDELAMFPSGAHDDQVDALSGAYDMLANKNLQFNFLDV